MKKLESYQVPGKVFILGEYAVLGGSSAILASLAPRFSLSVMDPVSVNGGSNRLHKGAGARNSEAQAFHPQSPISLLTEWANAHGMEHLRFQFQNFFPGDGGFGASTAQFAMAYLAYSARYPHLLNAAGPGWRTVWAFYRELTQKTDQTSEESAPSGADLVAQWQGGVTLFNPQLPDPRVADLWPIFDWSSLLVFSASAQPGRKVATHEHLKNFSVERLMKADLESTVTLGLAAIQKGELAGLGQAFNRYAEQLQSLGLEIQATTDDRQILSRLPGVLGVKGTGALQADAILVLISANDPRRSEVIAQAKARGLVLVSEGLTCEMGISKTGFL